ARGDRGARHDRAGQHPRRVHRLPSGGAGESAHHPQPRQGAVVLPLAAGDRHRHHGAPGRAHDQRSVPGGRAAPRRPDRRARRMALAGQEPRGDRRPVVPEEPAHAEPGLPRGGSRRARAHLHRHLLPRPVLDPLLAVAVLARHPFEDLIMEKRTDSPYSKSDRPVLAIVGVVLVISTILFARSDRAHEWRWYQNEFRNQVAEKLGADKARSVPTGIQQIWVPSLGRADRCITCHQAVEWKGFESAEEPWRTHPREVLLRHPLETYGCSMCHGGQGWAIDADPAHGAVEHWE